MAELWYYTSAGQQMEPVTKDELRQLAGRGLLKPTDLVWTEGMSKWLRASKVDGVFPDPANGFTTTPKSRIETAIPLAEPVSETDDLEERRRRPRRERDQDRWEDDDDYDRPRRRQKSSNGARVALILGSIAGAAVLVGIVIAVIFMVRGGSGGEGTRSFSLRTNEKTNHRIRFTKGKTVEIWVTSKENSDVDLFVFDERNMRVAFDDGPSKDCYVRFVPTATQTFRVEVWNRHVIGIGAAGRNRHNSGTLRFKESDHAVGGPIPDQNFPVAQPPAFVQPPIVQPPIIIASVGQPPIVRPPFVQPPIFKQRTIPVSRPPVFKGPNINPPRPRRFR